MQTPKNNLLSNRVLRMKVGFLLADGPGNSHTSQFDINEPVRVDDDLAVHFIYGNLRLSRMKEGILVESRLKVGADNECSRCLEPILQELDVTMQELYAYPHPGMTEFYIGQDGILDLAPLLRAEVLLRTTAKSLCRTDCKGLCPVCGTNWNHETCTCHLDDIDPRMAKLKQLLDSAE